MGPTGTRLGLTSAKTGATSPTSDSEEEGGCGHDGSPFGAGVLPARVNHASHRYPACIVWTPIHPISWFAPYIGHVGVCCSKGVVYDWTGMINRDSMAFGWPARYVHFEFAEVGCSADEWDAKLGNAVALFSSSDGPSYDFCTWNCHSLLVYFLNSLNGRGCCAGRWNLVSICGLFFIAGRFTTLCSVVSTFGPVFACYALALATSGWAGALSFFRLSCMINAVFVVWFVFATSIGVSGMHGRVRRPHPPSSAALSMVRGE